MPDETKEPGTQVELPCGIFRDGKAQREAKIVPMTGRVRKNIARPDVRKNGAKIIDAVLLACVREIGGRRVDRQVLDELLIGDGGNWIGPLGETHFPGWRQVLDFPHLFSHLYGAAHSVWPTAANRAWALYEKMIRAAWAGKVGEVLAELERQRDRIQSTASPQALQEVENTINYVRDNASRMRYPEYRRLGLPTTSTLVGSLIKQFNLRVKDSEKFWSDGGGEAILQVRAASETFFLVRRSHRGHPAGPGRLPQRGEAILQVRAAYLSEDGRDVSFHNHRQSARAANVRPPRRAA
ncbi:MAG: hypothetical protein HY719_11320 [Planctomycetes bacterium]|nr:hypothetical protein [Planctomycetota bacterium]